VNREASFKFRINRHNNVYWSDCNPLEVIQEELSVPGLTVGKAFGVAALWVLFGGTLLHEVVLPELENRPLYDNTEIIWQ
jgi:hypothetical protein